MATNYTTNYDLCQWEPTDAVQRVEFNADNAKIDAALKSLSDQVVQKANQSALNTLVTAVNQKADQTDLTAAVGRIGALEGGKADQASLDQAVSTLTAADRLVFLSQTSVESSVSAYTLPLPDWDGAWELQIRYNIIGTGEIMLSFNNGTPCYNSSSTQTVNSFRIKHDSRTSAVGLITLRPGGSSGRILCHVDGMTLDERDNVSYNVEVFCTVKNVTVQTLTQIEFTSDGGTVQAGSRFACYCVR